MKSQFPGPDLCRQVSPNLKKNNHQSGQAILVILLVSAVVLTMGLAVVSRSITDLKISEQTNEAARAYSAAEAGIEESLLTGSASNGTFSETGANYKTTVSGIGQNADEIAFPHPLGKNSLHTIWLSSSQTLAKFYDRNQIRVVWGNPGTPADAANTPALEMTIYYKDSATYKAAKWVLDPNSTRSPDPSFCNPGEGVPQCQGVSNFTVTTQSVGGRDFPFGATLDLSNMSGAGKTLIFARVRMLYLQGEHFFGVKSAGAGNGALFPAQGDRVESTGQSGQSTRKVEVVRYYPAPPNIFDFVLLSNINLSK